jgi:hypothetical protein
MKKKSKRVAWTTENVRELKSLAKKKTPGKRLLAWDYRSILVPDIETLARP